MKQSVGRPGNLAGGSSAEAWPSPSTAHTGPCRTGEASAAQAASTPWAEPFQAPRGQSESIDFKFRDARRPGVQDAAGIWRGPGGSVPHGQLRFTPPLGIIPTLSGCTGRLRAHAKQASVGFRPLQQLNHERPTRRCGPPFAGLRRSTAGRVRNNGQIWGRRGPSHS